MQFCVEYIYQEPRSEGTTEEEETIYDTRCGVCDEVCENSLNNIIGLSVNLATCNKRFSQPSSKEDNMYAEIRVQ